MVKDRLNGRASLNIHKSLNLTEEQILQEDFKRNEVLRKNTSI